MLMLSQFSLIRCTVTHDYHVLESKLEYLGRGSEVNNFSPSHSQSLLEG